MDAESRAAAVEIRKIPASVLEKRFQALEDAIQEMKSAIDRQNMVQEMARLSNLFEILQNTIMNETPPEGIQERRKCMQILESVMPSIEHVTAP